GQAGVEQELGRLRPGPGALGDQLILAIAWIGLVLGRARLELSGQLILEVPLLVDRERELVLVGRLDREAHAEPVVDLRGVNRIIEVGRVLPHRRRRADHSGRQISVAVEVGHARRRAPATGRAEEPHAILDEAAAERGVDVVDALDTVYRGQTLSLQIRGEIATLESA